MMRFLIWKPDDPERLAAYEEMKAAILESDKYLH